MLSVTHSPKDVAARYGCKVDKILALIANGELVAINVALNKNGGKPRWTITEESINDFERARSTKPKPKPIPRQPRRKVDHNVKQYF